MLVTAYSLAQRYIGIRELSGHLSHPLISWWLSLCSQGDTPSDEIPWCSAFVNGIAWELRLPRSKSALARSWLSVGTPIPLESARPSFDIVILSRGTPAPGPEVLSAPGHVGLFAGVEPLLPLPSHPAIFNAPDNRRVLLLGGNQSDSVSVAPFPVSRILGVRRLYVEES